MSNQNVYTLSPKQMKERLRISLKANVPALVMGQPSSSKSYQIKQLAEEEGLYLIDVRLSTLLPSDLTGFPKVIDVELPDGLITQVSKYVPMDVFPLENYPIPKGYKGFLLFFDELNSADKYTQAACYRIILDREVGNNKLHPECRIIAAGNRMSDNAVVHKLSSALKSRMTHITVEINPKEFLQYVEDGVSKGTWNNLVYSFLNFQPEYINNFDPKTDTETYSAPRTLEFLSKELDAGLLDLGKDIYLPTIIGIIGEKAGVAFNSFIEVYNSLPSIQAILNDPITAPLPEETGARYALGAYLANNITANNADKFIDYLERIDEKDLQVLAYRLCITKLPAIIRNPKVANMLSNLRHSINQP